MSQTRVTPHKPKREEGKAKELAVLKQENHFLKRRVKRLEKEIGKRIRIEEEVAEEGLNEEAEQAVKAAPKLACTSCGDGELRLITLNDKQYAVCPECKWRGRYE